MNVNDLQVYARHLTVHVTGTAGAGVVALKGNPERRSIYVCNNSPFSIMLGFGQPTGSISAVDFFTFVSPYQTFGGSQLRATPTGAVLLLWELGTSGSAQVTEMY